MCGFCGVFNEHNLATVTSMLDSIKHRGPDSFDVGYKNGHTYGGCRLRILGDKTEPLPSHFHNGMVLLNGEIYNYLELRKSLKAQGERFSTTSEEEVIAKLWQKHSVKAPSLLKGMFSIAIIEDDRLILIRDKFGIKPLYYKQSGEKVIFASEIKAILQHQEVAAILNRNALDELSVFGYIASPEQTLFKNIFQVPAGSVAIFEAGEKNIHSYNDLPESRLIDVNAEDYESSASTLYAIIEESMGKILEHGSQDKGFYLSGGIDSSLLATIAATHSDSPISTFTLCDSFESEDLLSARKVAKAIGANHHEFSVDINAYLAELPHFVHHYENIIAGGVFDIHGGIAFQLLSKEISKHVRVAFSGEGADELFGGYYWIYTHPLGFSDRIRNRLERFKHNTDLVDMVDTLFPQPEDEDVYRNNVFNFLTKGGLANYHLWSVDRSCSAFGFETRPAYLYDDITDYALPLPIEYKAHGTKTKQILKSAVKPIFSQFGIEDVIYRKKQGMPAAVSNIAVELDRLAESLITPEAIAKHPFSNYIIKPIDTIMIDLFFYIFFENKGCLPDDLSVIDFYKEGLNENLYA